MSRYVDLSNPKIFHNGRDKYGNGIYHIPPDLPTDDAAKHGRWKIYIISMLDGEGCKCSECGTEGAPYWNFCRNCGARMEGVKDGTVDRY